MPPSEIEMLRREVQEMRDEIARNKKQMDWLMEGHLSSKNIREIGGYNVNLTDFKSRDGDVGMSSANDAVDPVRMWAGSTSKDTAPWRVTKAGKMHATGATIESQGSYPKVVFEPLLNLLAAYKDALNYVSIEGNSGFSGAPTINLFVAGSLMGQLYANAGKLFVTSELDMNIYAAGGLLIDAFAGVKVGSFSRFRADDTGTSLQSALNAKANAFSGFTGTVYVASSSGGSPTVAKTFVNGVCTS